MPDQAIQAALADRKKLLVAEGQLYRVSIEHAKVHMANALRPEALMHGAIDQALGFAGARLGLLSSGGIKLQTVLPLLLSAGTLIVRRRLLKPALVLGVAAALALLWYRRRPH